MTRAVGRTAVAAVLAALVLAGCQSPLSRATASQAQNVALQPGDVPGMQRCAVSGDVATVLRHEKAARSPGYDEHATEWEQWKRQGALDAYFAVYGRTAADCAAASSASAGAPTGGLMVGLVVKFKDTHGAAVNFQRDSTLMGLGPKDIRFIELAGGTTTYGASTGLGTDSVVGNADVAGADYFVASWHSRQYQSEFLGYDMAYTDADNAVMAMNRQILQT